MKRIAQTLVWWQGLDKDTEKRVQVRSIRVTSALLHCHHSNHENGLPDPGQDYMLIHVMYVSYHNWCSFEMDGSPSSNLHQYYILSLAYGYYILHFWITRNLGNQQQPQFCEPRIWRISPSEWNQAQDNRPLSPRLKWLSRTGGADLQEENYKNVNRYIARKNCPVPVLISEHVTKHHWYSTSSTTHGPQIEITSRCSQAGFARQSVERARASETVSSSAFSSLLFPLGGTCFYAKFWSRLIRQSLVTRAYCEQFWAFIPYNSLTWWQNL